MKERPILMSAPMVRAVLDGSKTQTRRIVKPQPDKRCDSVIFNPTGELFYFRYGGVLRCPYGQPDDQLWVRETFVLEGNSMEWEPDHKPPFDDGRPIKYSPDEFGADPQHYWAQPHYKATDPTPELYYEDKEEPYCKWKPSIFMPRWASRIQLEIVNIRIERLQDISQNDAVAEGCDDIRNMQLKAGRIFYAGGPREAYRILWESINGTGSWDANPYVWVIEFKKVKA